MNRTDAEGWIGIARGCADCSRRLSAFMTPRLASERSSLIAQAEYYEQLAGEFLAFARRLREDAMFILPSTIILSADGEARP